jgi:hypothetical protein
MQTENTENTRPVRKKSRWKKIRNITFVVGILALALFFAIRFYYPFGVGVKTGELNYVVYKGVVFKTYEGKLIQSGFRSQASGIQSNEFIFSMTDKTLADSLMRMGGQVVELRYKEYFGRLPWRGYSKYIVDRIVSVAPSPYSGVGNLPPAQPETVE